MKSKTVVHYDLPHQFEPLMPGPAKIDQLLEKAALLTTSATGLGASTGAATQGELRALLRSMNSYYTNRMEGEHARPSDIERALQNDFSDNRDLARKQRLAVAHVRTELACEQALELRKVAGEDTVAWLYGALPSNGCTRICSENSPLRTCSLPTGRG